MVPPTCNTRPFFATQAVGLLESNRGRFLLPHSFRNEGDASDGRRRAESIPADHRVRSPGAGGRAWASSGGTRSSEHIERASHRRILCLRYARNLLGIWRLCCNTGLTASLDRGPDRTSARPAGAGDRRRHAAARRPPSPDHAGEKAAGANGCSSARSGATTSGRSSAVSGPWRLFTHRRRQAAEKATHTGRRSPDCA